MEKLSHATESIIDENVEKLVELFPEVVTEVREPDGTLRHTIDVDALKERVGDVAEGQRERYQFTWPGKREAKQEAYRQIDKCLRPCPEESVNWDTTQNLYIEGDNLDALKLLRNTYAGKIKMIYIDPPYNTGHDFIYDDDFAQTKADYDAESGDYDEEGGRLVANPESNGRFHSDWCSMMYPRLLLARDLLSEDGVIFISIDEGELANVSAICNEVFSSNNRVGIFKWNKTSKAPTLSRLIRNKYEYVLCYRRSFSRFELRGPDSYNVAAPLLNSGNPLSRAVIPVGSVDCPFGDGVYPAGNYGEGAKAVVLNNDLIVEKGVNSVALDMTARFKWTQETINERVRYGQRFEIKKPTFTTVYYYLDNEHKYIAPSDVLNKEECGVLRNDEAAVDLSRLFGITLFDYSKPVSLLRYLTRMMGKDDGSTIILDFFSGSATTAHAVMQLNAEDGGNRKFIMVQLPEACDEKSEAAKAGYKTICEIGKERIRRAGKKIAVEVEDSNRQLKLGEEPKKVPDIGFRVLKIDSSNFEDVSAEPGELSQDAMLRFSDNLKLDRTPDDLIIQVMLKKQIELSAPIEKLDVDGCTVFSVDNGRLVACFDRDVPVEVMTTMAKMEPDYAVMRDASFTGDDAVSNFAEIFKNYSSITEVEVI